MSDKADVMAEVRERIRNSMMACTGERELCDVLNDSEALKRIAQELEGTLRLLSAPVDATPAFEVIEKGGQPFFHIPHLNWPVGTKFYTHPPVDAARAVAWACFDQHGITAVHGNSHRPAGTKAGDGWIPLYTTPPNTVPVAELEALKDALLKEKSDSYKTQYNAGFGAGMIYAHDAIDALLANHKVTP